MEVRTSAVSNAKISSITVACTTSHPQLRCNFNASASPAAGRTMRSCQLRLSARLDEAYEAGQCASTQPAWLDEAHTGTLQQRGFATQSKADEYDLIQAESGLVRIEGYTTMGFVVNDVTTEGPLLALRTSFFSWAVQGLADVTPASLSALQLLNPMPEVLVVGTGKQLLPLPPALARDLATKGIGVETADTVNAMATFNILAQEGRHVAGAFLPLQQSD